jgi:type II secretory pathway component PulK
LINLNTASATVLQVIPEIDANLAQAIITARSGPDGQDGTDDDIPFRSPQEIFRAVPGVNPQALGNLSRYFTVRSLCFEAHVNVNVGGNKREYVAILRRNGPKDIQTLNLYWK